MAVSTVLDPAHWTFGHPEMKGMEGSCLWAEEDSCLATPDSRAKLVQGIPVWVCLLCLCVCKGAQVISMAQTLQVCSCCILSLETKKQWQVITERISSCILTGEAKQNEIIWQEVKQKCNKGINLHECLITRGGKKWGWEIYIQINKYRCFYKSVSTSAVWLAQSSLSLGLFG